MPKEKMGIFFLVLVLTSVLSFTSVGWSEDEDDLQQQIEQTKKKLSQTKMKENTVLGSLLRTQQELERINSSLDRLSNNLDRTEQRMEIITNQLNNAEAELERIKIDIGGRKGVLDQRLIAIYKYGYQSCLEVLFTAKSFSEFISRFEMIGDFVRGDIHILRTLQRQQDLIAKKRAEISQKQQELHDQKRLYSRLQAQTEANQNRKISALQDTKEQLSELQNDRRKLEEALDELEQTSKAMEAEIRNYQNKNKTALGTGVYIWPTPGRITSYFGYRYHPLLRKRKYHSGLDIAAPVGTPVKAADTGIVIFAGRNGGYGKMIAIDHGNEISTVYGHCSVLLVSKGQKVTQGEVIAKVGSTGLSTGPHLHFEVRKDGVPIDPLSVL